ncbi:MAG: Rrf2 family transcriptional regulator [Bdellovibrionota bacterium]|nr:MAG: Rrf2 family transcriptional regulator [Bdellovibrionota bacterium]
MKLTHRCEYALLALIMLARRPENEVTSAEQIALQQQIPKRFLHQILALLRQAKLVRASKGQRGGYALAKPANEISIAEVVRLFDGPIAPSKAASKHFYEASPIEREGKVLELLGEIRQVTAEILEHRTIADVA